jgi:hypothetical protein
MSDTEIPEEIRSLLRDRIPSHEQLEVLLLMHSDPARQWAIEEFSDNLRISVILAEEAVQHLAAAGLVELFRQPGKALRARGPLPAYAGLVDRLAQVYRDARLEVVMLMSANAIERMRTGAVRAFADAFVIKRKP